MDNNQDIPQDLWEEVERFLQHEMLPEEEEIFRARMSTDAQLKNTTEEMRLLFIGVQEASLQQKLNEFHDELATSFIDKKSPGKLRPMMKWLAAACIILFVSGAIFFARQGYTENLFVEYYRPDPGLISPMGTTEDYAFNRAMVDYKTSNYKAAIKGWEGLHAANPGSDTLNYFLGSAWLAIDRADKAIPYLQTVTTLPNSAFAKDAYWYLALTQLKQGDKKKAIFLLEKSDHAGADGLLLKLKKDR